MTQRYEIEFYQPIVSHLRKAPSLSHVSVVSLCKAYTLSVADHRSSIAGTITHIEPDGLLEFAPALCTTGDLSLRLGDRVCLRDRDGRSGEGLITNLAENIITIGNLSSSIQVMSCHTAGLIWD